MPLTYGSNLQKTQKVSYIKNIETEQGIHDNKCMMQSKNFRKAAITFRLRNWKEFDE